MGIKIIREELAIQRPAKMDRCGQASATTGGRRVHLRYQFTPGTVALPRPTNGSRPACQLWSLSVKKAFGVVPGRGAGITCDLPSGSESHAGHHVANAAEARCLGKDRWTDLAVLIPTAMNDCRLARKHLTALRRKYYDGLCGTRTMLTRQCPYCGKLISDVQSSCPYCRETLAPALVARALRSGVPSVLARKKIRQGLLYMLLAALISYFAGGYAAPLRIPVSIQPVVVTYLAPLLFVSGLGLSLYGLYLRRRRS